jgi:protein SCO1/2
LIDQFGQVRTDRDFHGQFILVYFGFTNCPDVCPEELDKMAEVVTALDADPKFKDTVTPVFITCDPQRDTVERVREYVEGKCWQS